VRIANTTPASAVHVSRVSLRMGVKDAERIHSYGVDWDEKVA
jgi:hypothetical protein